MPANLSKESGVALRFPPHSKSVRNGETVALIARN
jgi:hypothetical protein